MSWDLPHPFTCQWILTEAQMDHYGHINNAEYLKMTETLSWQHSGYLGLTLDDYRAQDRAMVVVRHELDYLAPAYAGDCVELATWVVECDGRNRLARRFQLQRKADAKTLFKARTLFACVSLKSHRPRRLPDTFLSAYLPALVTDVSQ